MEILVAFLIVLGLITLIGHGIWVLLAAIFRALSGHDTEHETSPQPSLRVRETAVVPPRQPRFCDHCGAVLGANGNLCISCGHPQLEVADKDTLGDLAATERQLQRWYEQGVLDEMKFNWLRHVVATERQRLTAPTPAAPPIVEPQVARAEAPLYQPPTTDHQPPTSDQPPATDHRLPTTDYRPPATSHQSPIPRKSFAEMLAAFMEEKNIRWGELLGGLLIIGCSLALVISLWAQIEQIPLLKFFIFTAMTGAFAGLGFYSEHRWKLPNTSRGLLITATMLVPLNFLAIAAFAKDMAASDPMVMASEVISLVLFVVMVLRAGKVVVPGWAHWLTLGVVGTSAMQLLLRRVAGIETSTITLCLLAALPLACYAAATFGMLRNLRSSETLEVKTANQSFTLLSASSFAAVVALGLLLFKTQAFVVTLERIAPMVTWLAIPALLAGLMLWQRVRNVAPSHLVIVSTSIAVFSALVMLASLVFAWPNVINVMIVAGVNFLVLSFVAFAFRLPAAHLAALPCFGLLYLLSVNWALGQITTATNSRELLTALFSLTSGKALAGLFVLLLGACEFLRQRARKDDGVYYAIGAAGVGALSFVLVSLQGFGIAGDPHRIAWVYALFAASAFYGAWRVQRAAASYLGWGLAFLALTQFLHYGWERSFKLTTLIYATLALAVTMALRRFKKDLAMPSQHIALFGAILTGVVLWLTALDNTASVLAAQTVWLAVLVAALAWLYRSPALFTAFQAITYASVFFAVTAATHGNIALSQVSFNSHDLRRILLAFALLSSGWIGLRLGLHRFGIHREAATAQESLNVWQHTAARLLYPAWPTCDQLVMWALIAVFVGLSWLGVMPGIRLELAPPYVFNGVRFATSTEWILLGALLVTLTISLWEQFTRRRVLGILLLLALICPLLARSSAATASTWRWAAAMYLLLTACALWFRARLYTWAQAMRFPLAETEVVPLANLARAWTLFLGATPILALTVFALGSRVSADGLVVPSESFLARIGAVAAYLIPLFVLSAVLVGHSLRERVSGYAFAGGLTLNLAATVWYLNVQFTQGAAVEMTVLTALNVIVWALSGLALFAFVRAYQRDATPYHRATTALSLLGVTLLTAQGLLFDFNYDPLPFHAAWRWGAVLLTLALMTANLWDATAKLAVIGLYALGLVIAGTAVDQANLSGAWHLFALTMCAAGYALFTSWLWAERARLCEWTSQWGIPLRSVDNGAFEQMNTILIVLMLSFGGIISRAGEPFVIRLFVALAVALQVMSFALLARGSARTWALHIAALSFGLMGAVLLGWAFLPSSINPQTVHRAVIVLLVAWLAAEVFGLWFVQRFANEWSRAAKSLLYPLCGVVALFLGGLLANEVLQQSMSGQVVVPMFAILSVAAILLILSMQAIYFAVRAERDPLQLSERGRMGYVYVSEALLALMFLHIRLTMPWLFTGFFTRYWPFVVMALAFVGVGLGEMFRRRGQRVLGEPLLNTGFFLPLFPVIGFWLVASRIDYSGLLLVVGILYAIVAVLRGSFGVSLLACLAANGALWYFLSRLEHFSLLERPQLWLTPAALSVLLATYLNRARLTAQQMTSLRYVKLSVLYVSSTAEIFVRGVAESPWQPMVLMMLSAAGVLTGMLLRVRAFLYLGSSFLLISIVTMIWHAAANFGWTWLWYVTGIIVGLAIILLFAMFEKKRSELLRLVEGLRTWEA